MPEAGNLGQLETQEWQRLQQLADQLENALADVDSVDLSRFLPPPGTPKRLVFLHELIKTEMEIRCRRQKTVLLDEYLKRYPELGTTQSLSVELIFEEFRIRHRYGDKPPLDKYRQRFPNQFDQLRQLEKKDPVATVYNTGEPKAASSSGATKPDKKPNTPGLAETLPPETMPPAPPLPRTLPPPSTPMPSTVPLSKQSNPSNPSRVLPSGEGYQLLERIGGGQFGEVYRGLAPGGVVVAIKRIMRSLEDGSSQRELQALEKFRELNHPYLLQTHNYYAYEDRLVIVMELADGSLRDRFKECKKAGLTGIPVDELLRYFGEAAEALDFLREQKLTHRDIKPENLLRLKGHAKVADFGVARRQESSVDETTNVAGTPAYISPEMWGGKISQYTDQYSFAATWYEMRTGKRVFSGKTQIDIAQQHLRDKPALTAVPEAEQKVLLRALAKKPEERYPDCKAFVQALAIAIAPPPPPPPVKEHGWTVKIVIALLGLALAALVISLIAVLVRTPATTSGPPDRGDTKPPDVPLAWDPDKHGFGIPPDAEITTVRGKRYYNRITRKIGDEEVVFLLIPWENPDDPSKEMSFYIMQNKVSNGLFKTAVADPVFKKLIAQQQENFQIGVSISGATGLGFQFHVNQQKEKVPKLKWGAWTKGGVRNGGDEVGSTDDKLPVLRVNLMEAWCFAHWIKGNLPLVEQWDRAAGKEPGVKDIIRDPANKILLDGDVAINRLAEGPMAVSTARRDFGRPDKCSDMAGNGLEWTRNFKYGGLVSPETLLEKTQKDLVNTFVTVRSQRYYRSEPFSYDLPTDWVKWFLSDAAVGFRVVIEP